MTFRRAERSEIQIMIDWAAAEGWNPGIDDLDAFIAADPSGYWLAEVEGQIAAAVSLVHHDPSFAFLGFYMAAPEFRGRGIAMALWNHAMAESKAATIGLDGVVAQQDNYRKSGFVYAHANWRYAGDFDADAFRLDSGLIEPSEELMPALIDFDARHNPSRRPSFLSAWLAPSPSRHSLVAMKGHEVVGLGTIRRCREGHKIGPLFAETPTLAEQLFAALVASVGGGRTYLDIPGPNEAAKALCEQHGMQPVFETARMYSGTMPDLPLDRIFGITTFELG